MILTILKKYWSQIGLLIAIILLSLSIRQCQVNSSAVSLLSQTSDSVRYYRLKNGEIAAQVEAKEVTIKELKKFGGQLGFDKKQLEQQVGRLSNLVAHWKGKVRTSGEVAVISLKDTLLVETMDESLDLSSVEIVTMKTFEWSNKYLSLEGIIELDSNQLALKYQYTTDFTLTAYHKRQGLFKQPKLMADISFADPNIKTTEFRGLVVTPPKKTFWQSGVGKMVIGFGIGVATYSMIGK